MNDLLKRRSKLRRGVSIFTSVTTILWLSGVALLAGPALAVVPADFGLTEGDTISANDLAGDPDVYIVNDPGFKRLFLNPVIFGFYGHLGFDKVKQVTSSTRDAFPTSGLFRLVGEERVYGVETTGEDTGILHWVNMSGSAAVAEDPDFFLKVFTINQNEFNWYTNNGVTFGSDYTALSQVPDYTRDGGVVTGPVSLSLAPGNPASVTVTSNAQGVTALMVRLTGTGTLQELIVTRGGAGDNADFSNVFLYDGNRRLTSSRSINSSTGTITFVNLGLAVNGTRDLSVVVDLSSPGTGNVHFFEVAEAADVKLAGSVSAGGSYPVRGNVMSVAAANGGTITVAKVGSLSNPSVGQKRAQLTEFKLTTATEAGLVKRMRFLQDGTVIDANINNVVVETLAGAQVGTGVMSGDGYLDLVFNGAGFSILKGDNETFLVYGDLGGKKDETIKLYLELDADTLAIGDQFGFGMAVTDTELDQSSEAHSLTLRGGDLTLAFGGPNATNIGTDTSDTHFIDFTITGQSSIELKSHKILLCADQGGDGTFDAITAVGNFADLEDIKIINVDTGAVLVGPADGDAFTTASASCPGGVSGMSKTFTDNFDVLAGQTLNLALTADVKTANSALDGSGTDSDLGDTDIVQIILESYADLAGTDGSLSVAKYIGTNTAVGAAQMVPAGDLSSNNMTINSTGLTLGLAGSPVSTTHVKGTLGVDVVGLTFRASLASAITVKKVTLTGLSGADNSGNLTIANVGSLVDVIKLYDGDTGALIPSTIISNTLASDGKIQFDNMVWMIPAGVTKTLLAKADLSTNVPVSTKDTFSFDIEATSDVTALDNASQSTTVTGNNLNGGATATVAITVGTGGSMTAALSPSTPIKQALYWGQSAVEVARFRYTATDEAFFIEKLTYGASATGTEVADLKANVKSFVLEYPTKDNGTQTQSVLVTAGASANFGFAGVNRPYVPKDSSMDVIVRAVMKTKAEGATSTGAGDSTSPVFGVRHMDTFDGSQTNGFRAVGEGSGTVLDGSSAGVGTEVDANDMYVYRIYPKFSHVVLPAGEPLGTKDVFKFTIEAMGLPDANLFFDNAATGSGSIKFATFSQATATTSALAYTFYDVLDGSIVDTGNFTANDATPNTDLAVSQQASISFVFGTKDIEITGGQSKTFRLEMSFVGFTATSDFFQMFLKDNEAALVQWVDNSTGTTANPDVPSIAGTLRTLPMNSTTFSKL